MEHGLGVLIDDAFYEVTPSCEHILGFVLTPGFIMGFESASPTVGVCSIRGAKIDVHATIKGYRDVSLLGILGIRLHVHDMHISALLGCLIIQNDKVVGIVQTTADDIWGYPFDLLLARANGRKNLSIMDRITPANWSKPLKLIENYDVHFFGRESAYCYSAEWQCHVRPDREIDKNTINGIVSELVTSNDRKKTVLLPAIAKLPSDTRCLNLGGLIIHPGSMIVDILPDTEIKGLTKGVITCMNRIKYPSIDQIISILNNEKSFLLMVGDNYALFKALTIPRECSYARSIVTGVYMWGFAAPASDVEYDAMPDNLSVDSIPVPKEEVIPKNQNIDLLTSLLDLNMQPPVSPSIDQPEDDDFMEANNLMDEGVQKDEDVFVHSD